MSAIQNGVCAICSEPETRKMKGTPAALCVDHNHETGEIRGLLCNRCNRTIGLLEDDPEFFKRAYDYLNYYNRT